MTPTHMPASFDDEPVGFPQYQKRHRCRVYSVGRWMNCTRDNALMLLGLRSWESRVLHEPGTQWVVVNAEVDKFGDAESILRELVALKRLHDAIGAAEAAALNYVDGVGLPFARDDYERRKVLAWARAFELVDTTPKGQT